MFLEEQWNTEFGSIKAGIQIHIHDVLPVFPGHIHEKPHVSDACIVHQHIQSGDVGEQLFYLGEIAHVGLKGLTWNVVRLGQFF